MAQGDPSNLRGRDPTTLFEGKTVASGPLKGATDQSNGYGNAWAAGVHARMVQAAWSGSYGLAPDYTHWVNSQPYVTRNLIPVLLEAPRAFNNLPNGEHWVHTLKAMIETVPTSITGLQAGIEVQTDSRAFGGAGQVLEVFTNTKRTVSDIAVNYYEREGLSIFRFYEYYIRLIMMDPETKLASINTIAQHQLNDLMADQYSMTVMFIEPDPTGRYVRQAWLVTNMWPKGTGANEGKRDITADQSLRDITINFAGLPQYGAGVDEAAQIILTKYKLAGADPHARQAWLRDINSAIEITKSQGYLQSIHQLAEENVINHPDNSAVGAAAGATVRV